MEELNQDSQAIARLKQGDLTGLDDLLERYQLRAVRTAYLIVLDRPLAEDIVQNAFVRLVRKINQFDDTRPFAPWFLRSVINDALKAIRREARWVSFDVESTEEIAMLTKMLADPQPGPEEWAINAETCREIWQALGCLPPEQRSVIVQRYYLGYSEAEMSAQLQRPRGTIKWLLHNARQRLRIRLAGLVQPVATTSKFVSGSPEASHEE
ncbi:MAG: sigma-70 family RNA polymerase sigma factor [Chloroflexota bacterium]